MTGHGEIIHKNHKYVGKFKENYVKFKKIFAIQIYLATQHDSFKQPKGNGKYVFDMGSEQIGEYLTTAQVFKYSL